MSAEVTGRNVMYQWFMVVDGGDDIAIADSAIVFGGDTDTLIITQVSEAGHDGTMYYVQITNGFVTIQSNTVTITVGEFSSYRG